MRIEEAIGVFGCGFTFTRSFTHPYELERVDSLWVMRDAPRKKPEYRNEEWLVYGVSPDKAEEIIQANRRGRYFVCVFCTLDEPDKDIREGYKAHGYRLRGTEMLFVHPLADIPSPDCRLQPERVTDMAIAERLAAAAGTRQILTEDLTDSQPRLRQYVTLENGEPVGWVRSISCGDYAWCSNMFVRPSHRRQGIAKALMARMLEDDKDLGLKANVLLASHAGAFLYPQVGYEPIGQLFAYKKTCKE